MDSNAFIKLGNVYTKTKSTSSKGIAMRRFKSFFGIVPSVCSIVWDKIQDETPCGAEPKHLLWCLSFLKQYTVEHYRRSLFKADEKTIRKWTWIFVELLSNLNVINWESRLDGAVIGQSCFTSLDGVDFKILEPQPFSRAWFSHKFRHAALRYEIALNIRTGTMVWVHGGYPCGLYPDLTLAREAFVLSLNEGERTIADKGYNDAAYFILPNVENSKLHNMIRGRQQIRRKR